MKVDILVAEIGSTTTVINAFNFGDESKFVGQGQSATTVLEGDVNIGLRNAINDLKRNLNMDDLDYSELLATSSAAGGLKMTVHGLVYDMTVKAAKEAALGAGANIKMITSGRLRRTDIEKIKEIKPNIILLAGGVDYGERETAIYNAELLAGLNLQIPIIYAGNIENQEEIKLIFKETGIELYVVENVYPKIDELNIEPTKKIIQKIFERHIIHAPGMEKVRDLVTGSIMPTPGAVMAASEFIYSHIGNLVTLDVGGATTDIHSVTEDSDEISRILLSPEPLAKRTVEGDLGLYINMLNLVDMIGRDNIIKELDIDQGEFEKLLSNHKPIPESKLEKSFMELLTKHAIKISLSRHRGYLKTLYGPSGKMTIAEGKDLTQVKYIIGTGGALTRLSRNKELVEEVLLLKKDNELLPHKDVEILIDKNYIMASLGVMSKDYPEESVKLLKSSLG